MPEESTREDSLEQLIGVAELADELGCRKQSLFKVIDRLGIKPRKRRDSERGNQLISIVSSADALRIKAEVFARRRPGVGDSDDSTEQLISDEGMFYLIQLEPEHDPGRIRLGFSTDLRARLQKHRCSAPFAQYVKSWPCRRTWERTAIDCITDGLEQLHTEVFRASSIEEVLNKACSFFDLMPRLADLPDEPE